MFDLETELAVVEALIKHHIPSNQICQYVKISKKDFIDRYQYLDDVERAISPSQAVENSMMRGAIEGNSQLIIYFMKDKAERDAQAAEAENLKNLVFDKVHINVLPASKQQLEDLGLDDA
jgi:hypothetical protein